MAETNHASDALKMIPYGFYAVGSKHEGEVNLMVANWFTQVSFSPLLVVLGLQASSYTHSLISRSKTFTLNILDSSGLDTLKKLTKGHEAHPDKLDGVGYQPGSRTGAPMLDVAAAVLEVEVNQIVTTGGDHNVVIGAVVAAEVRRKLEPTQTLSLPTIGWSYAG